MNEHVDVSTLAAFADGSLPGPDADRVRGHVAECRSCMAAYADAIRYRAAWLADSEAFRLDARQLRLANGDWDPDSHRRETRRRRLTTAVFVAAALSLPLVLSTLQTTNRTPTLRFELPPAVLEASITSSERGLILPGAESHADRVHPELRSSQARTSPELLAEVKAATDAYERGERGPSSAATVVAALLAAGELDNAAGYARECLRDHPKSVPLLVFAADVRFRSDDLAGAEELLRRATRLAPRDPLVTLDLALVLWQTGREEEARTLLRSVAKSNHAPIASRARNELSRER